MTEKLLNSATTSLNSKTACQYSSLLPPTSASSVMEVTNSATAVSVDLRDVKIGKKLHGRIDDHELVEVLVLIQRMANSSITRVKKAKFRLIQICFSAPKTYMDNQLVVSDSVQMD